VAGLQLLAVEPGAAAAGEHLRGEDTTRDVRQGRKK
jgi:hypothetical protein